MFILPALATCLNLALGSIVLLQILKALRSTAAQPAAVLIGASILLGTCFHLELEGPWPRASLPWLVRYFEPFAMGCSGLTIVQNLTLGGLYLGIWTGYAAFCRGLVCPSERNAKFALFSSFFMLAAFLWLQAGIDFMRFRSAMDLRLEACRKIHQGDLPGAIGLLEQAFARDPGQLDIAADLADLYRETGCSEQALFVLNRAVSLSPRRPQPLATVYAQRGLFLLHIGKPLAASQDLRTALRWEPKNEKVRGWLRLADRQLLK